MTHPDAALLDVFKRVSELQQEDWEGSRAIPGARPAGSRWRGSGRGMRCGTGAPDNPSPPAARTGATAQLRETHSSQAEGENRPPNARSERLAYPRSANNSNTVQTET